LSVGNTYYHMGSYRQALTYFNRIYPELKEEKSFRAASLFNSLALTYGELGDYKQVAALQQRALDIHRQIGDSLGILNSINNLGKAAVSHHEYETARKYFEEALGFALQMGNKSMEDVERQNLAFIQSKTGSIADAAAQYRNSVATAHASGNIRLEKAALRSLIELCDSQRDYESANRYMAAYQSLEDTLHNKTYANDIADAETKYQTQKALRDRDRLGYERNIQAAAARAALNQRNSVIAISGLSLLALLSIFGFAWHIRTSRARIQEEKRATRAIFEGEQTERIRIARDLHDSIGQMLAVVKMRLSSNTSEEPENKTIITNLLDKTITEVRSISHNLIPEDLNFGAIRALENLCTQMGVDGGIKVSLKVDDNVRAQQINPEFGLSLYRIVQEVLSNMIKHSDASEINMDITQRAGMMNLLLADNGKGFDTSLIAQSSGIGWRNIYARVALLNGTIQVRSENLSGTTIQITIPQ